MDQCEERSPISMLLRCSVWTILFLAVASTPSYLLAETPAAAERKNVSTCPIGRCNRRCEFKATGEQISTSGFSTDGWHSTKVPSTVVAALVADKTIPDPDFGMNLREFPGPPIRSARIFRLLPMPQGQPVPVLLVVSHGIRTRPPDLGKPRVAAFWRDQLPREHLAEWAKIADEKDVAGAYRTYEFDVDCAYLASQRANVLAVETFAQTEKDLGINWVDWNPAPPDKDMGLWRDVYLARERARGHPQSAGGDAFSGCLDRRGQSDG